jgi:hemerythrin-like domain-containing protein
VATNSAQKPEAVQIILDEHLSIAAVVYTLRYLARGISDGKEPDFQLLRAILDYIVEYPDRWHHPKENLYLFRVLRSRNKKSAKLIDELKHEHVQCDDLITRLKENLVLFAQGDQMARARFLEAVERYAHFQWAHIRKEEDLLLPMAEQALTVEDWEQIASAFRDNDNPLFGIRPKDEAQALYRKIMEIAPPPIGQGQSA